MDEVICKDLKIEVLYNLKSFYGEHLLLSISILFLFYTIRWYPYPGFVSYEFSHYEYCLPKYSIVFFGLNAYKNFLEYKIN